MLVAVLVTLGFTLISFSATRLFHRWIYEVPETTYVPRRAVPRHSA